MIKRVWIITLLLFAVLSIQAAVSSENPTLPWPVKAEPGISSSFCEFRSGHFHAGIDIKVYGVIGVPCVAVADGHVSRIKTSHAGYGRALYLELEDGRTAVYAHLDHFTKAVEERIKSIQHETGEFAVDYFTDNDSLFRFKQGDVVAFAGRSGTKHAHLHFEIRDRNQKPLNPLLEGIKIPDHIPPVPVAFTISPMDGRSTVEGDCQPRIWNRPIRRNDGIWGPRDQVGVSGRVGISIDCYDKTDASENLVALYDISMLVNGKEYWKTQYNEFSYDESDQVEIERDYRMWRTGHGVFNRLYKAPGNTLDLGKGEGIIDLDLFEKFPVDVDIILSDISGNQTVVKIQLVPDAESDDDRLVGGEPMYKFVGHGDSDRIRMQILDKYIRFSGPPGIEGFNLNGNLNGNLNVTLPAQLLEGGAVSVWIPPVDFQSVIKVTAIDHLSAAVESRQVTLHPVNPESHTEISSEKGEMLLEVPVGSVFETTWLRITPEPAYLIPGKTSTCLQVEPIDQPLAKTVRVKLKNKDDVGEEGGWGVYYLDSKQGWIFLGNEQDGDYLYAETLSWELFGLVRDVDKPIVRVTSPSPDGIYTNSSFEFRALVDDSTSGLTSGCFTLLLDGRKVPVEYDSPRDRLLYNLWKPAGVGEHQIKLTVTDRVGNTTEESINFFIER